MVEDIMKIDITDSNLQSFISLAQKFPNGTITAEKDKAYWEFDGEAQVIQQPQQVHQPNQLQRPQQNNNSFLNAFDALASRF